MNEPPISEEDIFHTEAIYGMETRQPLVQVLIGKTTMMVSTEEARTMGEQLITTAFAADADGFLVEWLNTKVGQPLEVCAQILRDFRQWRFDRAEGRQ